MNIIRNIQKIPFATDGIFFYSIQENPRISLNLEFYTKAFTHRSSNRLDLSEIHHYERLEFLGDAMLMQLLLLIYLMKRFLGDRRILTTKCDLKL
jgi:ribonuclease-3